MKNIKLIILFLAVFSCKKNETFSQNIENKEYIYDFHKEKNIPDNVSNYFGKSEYQFENYLTESSREEYILDSISFNNEISNTKDLLEKTNSLKLPYGNIKFVNDNNENSDHYSKYSYIGFSKNINTHIINIELYENNRILLVNNSEFHYNIIESEPVISPNNSFFLTYNNNDGLNSNLIIYNIQNHNFKVNKTLWSEDKLIDNVIWSKKNYIILKLRNISNDEINYMIVRN